MKRILVTGATGFIGTYVVGELIRRGHQVIASSANPGKAKSWQWYAQTTYLPLDLAQLDNTKDYWSYFLQPDLLIHLAWEGLPDYKKPFHFEENLPRHYQFLKNLLLNGLKDLTVTGTCLEYGMREGALREDMDTAAGTAYGLAKDTLRKFLEVLSAESPFSLKWARLFYMYGEGQNARSLFSQLDRALSEHQPVFPMSGGEQVRDYLPVKKMAGYICAVALQDQVLGIINCCSGRPVLLKKAVEEYISQRGGHIRLELGVYPYPDYEPMSFWGDTAKLDSILDAQGNL